MRNLIALIIVAAAGFVLVGMYVAPTQPALREWYQTTACPTLDKLSPLICDPIRKAQDETSGKV